MRAAETPELAPGVARLRCFRGIDTLSAVTILAEVGDFRRFGSAASFMAFTGLVPSEHSSGLSVHHGSITKTGNAHLRRVLVEAAWAYRHRPAVGQALAKRLEGQPPEVVAYCLGGPVPAVGPIPHPRPSESAQQSGGSRGPGARRLCLGHDDGQDLKIEMQKRAGEQSGKILEPAMRLTMRVASGRQVPARPRCAVSIRGYQSGRAPMPRARSLVHLERRTATALNYVGLTGHFISGPHE